MSKKQDNKYISDRFDHARKRGDVKEMYIAKEDYDKNLKAQREELEGMEKGTQAYHDKEAEIREQEERSKEMARDINKNFSHEGEKVDKLEEIKHEQRVLESKMGAATRSGNTQEYDKARRQYEQNIKAQEGICRSLKTNGIDHEDTTGQQRINQRNMDNDMADHFQRRIEERTEKGKDPNPKDVEKYQKYMGDVHKGEKEELQRMTDKRIEQMKNYGLSDEELARTRKEMEQENARLLGEDRSK